MQTFLKIFAGFLIIFVLVGLILDNKFEVSREITINASPETIHFYVNDLNQWPQWSPWQEMDATVKTTIGEISSGVGASQVWIDQTGGGSLVFTQSSASQGITYDLAFADDEGKFESTMQYFPQGEKTLVRWTMTGEMQPLVIGNYFALLMDALVGDGFNLGLENLKRIAEAPQS